MAPTALRTGSGGFTTASPSILGALRSGMTFGQYQLIREIGRGGMGAVYLARDTRLGRRVAIKFLAHASAALAQRFLAEARATARCKHDNIIDIYDVGEQRGYSFMVLEFIEGITLRAWLEERWQPNVQADTVRRLSDSEMRQTNTAVRLADTELRLADTAVRKPDARSPEDGARADGAQADSAPEETGPPEENHRLEENHRPEASGTPSEDRSGHRRSTPVSQTQAAELMIPVVRALQHAHRQGLVHRDLKPENIMLADSGSLKVLDFGIAKTLEDKMRDGEVFDPAFEFGPHALGHTGDGALIGTMPYMSPEQWKGRDLDGRSDLWAVGIMLWELVTGRHPLAPLSRERLVEVGTLASPMPLMSERHADLQPLAGLVDRCLRKRSAERIASAEALLAELERMASIALDGAGQHDNPYVALAAFQQRDAARFFGREREVSRLLGQLRNHRIVTVAGASGAGKSSLLRAGVIPALQRSGKTWEIFVVRPGRHPLAALANVVQDIARALAPENSASGAQETRESAVAELRAQPGSLGTRLRAYCRQQRINALVMVDQFEELYTLGADREARALFVACLEGVADDVSSPLRVALTLRSDFFDRVAEDRAFSNALTDALTFLSPMQRDDLRQALTRPLATTGYRFESDALLDSMLDALEATRTPLPLLQFTAARLWETRDQERQLISQESYDQLGGIAGALASHADSVLASFSSDDQVLARTIFTSLVSDERTRAIVGLSELRARVPEGRGDAVERCVQRLAQARLLLIESDDGDDGSTVELVHESLIERWPTLVAWLTEDQEASQFRSRLQAAARQWHRQGRHEDLLWRGQSARDASRWHERDVDMLAQLGERDRAYLQAVIALDARARRRRRQLVASAIGLLGLVAVLVSVLAFRADRQAARADREARQARASELQARQSEAQARQSEAQARQSTAEAARRAAQARNASRLASATLHRLDASLVLALMREMEPEGAMPPQWRELARWASHQDVARVVFPHPDLVYAAAFSPDGTRVATACDDGIARVWNADGTGQPIALRGHLARVSSAVFSPDGERIVTASDDQTARVWNADGTGRPRVLQGHRDRVSSAAFSPDGTRVVTSSDDGNARVFRADGTGQSFSFDGHAGRVASATFSPDGTRVASASDDKTAQIWNADGTGRPIVLRGHGDRIYAVAFSPDGMRLVTSSRDKTARIWNADGSGPSIVLEGHLDRVYSAAFSADGTRVITASFDKTARIWNADGTGRPIRLRGHRDRVYHAAFSPDDTRMVTASWDRTVRVWATDAPGRPIRLLGHRARVSAIAFSPDGTRVVTASDDRTARVWNADGTGQPIELRGHRDRLSCAAFSPDGTRVVTASFDQTARIWNADGTGQPMRFQGHRARVHSAAFSPDGTRIVTASFDQTARIWNADGTGQPLILDGHEDRLYSAAFSPDGRHVVTASFDRTARVWNADGTGRPLVLRGHQGRVYSAAFSPDGTRIVTASWDKTARVWRFLPEATGPLSYVELVGHESILAASGTRGGAGAFSPDGTRVLTIADDKTLRLWSADGVGSPAILHVPGLDAYSAAFSPDGTHIATASHSERNPFTGETVHEAILWPTFDRFTGLDDPALWTATRYCPSVPLRVELLGVPEDLAHEQWQRCQQRVAAAFSAPADRP